ncbi:MAG: hypothetical protein A2W91_04650 [Bacteroidetes bacterium GWF2_38_335]|nr:MAG: hypothetical protein A2W91_04650 [Bacteroidetes bacterium GWF2_38_335]OFY80041.1 MAG: hypothetical protein A2281_12205 [Bacteroidetes bacterium RIFOXYA12_FULL_38_20]HBS85221.1 hypothetical protein [Bacteroidales bacterium]
MKRLFASIFFCLIISFSYSQGSGYANGFNGTQAMYITTSATTDFAGWDDFTISAWVYHTNSGGYRTIYDKAVNTGDNGKFNIHIDITPSNIVRFNVNKEGVAWEELLSVNTIPANTWVHIACVKSLNITTLYINGRYENSMTIVDAMTGTSNAGINTNVGRLRRNGTFYYVGMIDELAVFRTALTQDEIREWMCKTITFTHPRWSSLVSYIRMNENTGWTCFDASGNGNNLFSITSPTWALSGAAIGDQSVYSYPANWTGQTLTLSQTAGNSLTVSNVVASANSGAHIYYVGSNPNTTSGISLTGTTNSYYGVYFTDYTATHTVSYNYDDFTAQCELCNPLYARNDNAKTTWIPLSATHTGCVASATGQSTVDQVFRSEYFVSIQNEDVNLGPDVAFCDGNSITLDATHTPATYLWQDATTNPTLSALTTGTYHVSVYYEGCTMRDTMNLTVYPNPGVTLSSTAVNCFGGTDGSVSAVATGGTIPYDYNWNSGQTTSSVSGLPAGNYIITVTDDNFCTITGNIDVTEPATALSSLVSSATNVSCFGGNNGAATVSASGGTPGYTYLWSNSAVTPSVSGLIAGVYSVNVTDLNGCTSTASVTITEPAILASTISGTNLLCNGDGSGTATISVSGGTTPYSYLWSNGAVTPSISGLSVGVFGVTVTDANGCSLTNSVTLSQPQPLSSTVNIVDASCNGFNDGSATINVSGGTTTYSYLWSSGGISATETGLSAGNYTVTVTDFNGCTLSAAVTINEPTVLSASISGTNASCFGFSDGNATVTPSGGTPSYNYLWSSGGTNASETGLVAGTYIVTVSDSHSCSLTQTIVVTEPAELVLTPSQVDILCNGMSTGSASVSVAGGTNPYYYSWSSGGSIDSETGLAAGTYTVTVTDDHNCSLTNTYILTQPEALSGTMSTTDASCMNADGTGTFSITGGVGPYDWQWSVSAGSQTTETATGLAEGTYNVTVTDANLCTISGSATINNAGVPVLGIDSLSNVLCYNIPTGYISLEISSGGTPPFDYTWSTGALTSIITDLAAGTYIVTVQDAGGCTATETYYITQPAELTSGIIDQENLLCFGDSNGSATVTGFGGTPPFSYLWDDPASSTSYLINGLTVGVYNCTLTDDNGCTSVSTATITEPTELAMTSSATPQHCGSVDGTAEFVVSGGTPAYEYLWSSGQTTSSISGVAAGSYFITVNDNNNCSITGSVMIDLLGQGDPEVQILAGIKCYGEASGQIMANITGGYAPFVFEWSNGSNNDTISTVTAGWYFVTITDDNACAVTDSIELTQPDQIIIAVTTTDVLCYGDSTGVINAFVTGGTPGYTYLWSDGQTTTDATGLPAAGYSVTVTDANNCIRVKPNIYLTQPPMLVLEIDTLQLILCNGGNGSLSAEVSGGVAPYDYSWSNGVNDSLNTNVTAGFYQITATDYNNCSVTDTISVYQPDSISILLDTVIAVSCAGNNDGVIAVNVGGGTGEYTFNWSNSANTDNITGLTAGVYTVTITDGNSCELYNTYTLDESDISCYTVEIPNAFSPNGDDVNDTWEIKDVISIENVEIEIYNRWGQMMFSFAGTGSEYADRANQWDGTWNGSEVPFGAYIYIVKFNGDEPLNGIVTIKR